MSKKDYIMLARLCAKYRPNPEFIKALADNLALERAEFNKQKFLEACAK